MMSEDPPEEYGTIIVIVLPWKLTVLAGAVAAGAPTGFGALVAGAAGAPQAAGNSATRTRSAPVSRAVEPRMEPRLLLVSIRPSAL
jgi:hypothetical protein